jgi:hypothetical protein
LITLNGLICFIAYIVDIQFLRSRYRVQTVSYERIDNIKPENRTRLIEDLRSRTGLNVVAIEIIHIDFLKDTAELNVKYLPVTTQKQAEEFAAKTSTDAV